MGHACNPSKATLIDLYAGCCCPGTHLHVWPTSVCCSHVCCYLTIIRIHVTVYRIQSTIYFRIFLWLFIGFFRLLLDVGAGYLFGWGVGFITALVGVNLGAAVAFSFSRICTVLSIREWAHGFKDFKVCR